MTPILLNLYFLNFSDTTVKTIACCPGSGKSVLSGCEADIWLTGEMSHHDILDACQTGITVILCEHSNSERGFLKDVKEKIFDLLDRPPGLEIRISGKDRDPVLIV